jgi:outer membrane PBP1 activator LpoA protein
MMQSRISRRAIAILVPVLLLAGVFAARGQADDKPA